MTVFATAGHVDHGKSTLVEALTGVHPDRLAEEKRRGLTIDLGFAHTTLAGGAVISFVDVPGHSRFLPNMLAGVGSVDACLFVVDAVEGWRAQSEEHLRIVDLLGIGGGVVAVTKTDLVDASALSAVCSSIASHLVGTVLADAVIVPVSAATGAGLSDLRAALDEYVTAQPSPVDIGRPLLWIDRSFTSSGRGTIVTGTSQRGSFAVGDRLTVEPGAIPVRVRGIQVHGAAVDRVGACERVALNLADVKLDVIGRGRALVRPDDWHLTDRFDGELVVVAALDHPVRARGAYVAYIGSGEFPARLTVLGGGEIEAGSTAMVRLRIDQAVPLLPGDRYVLRESGRDETIGGGRVIDIDPIMRPSRAAPDLSWERVVAERGWITTHDLQLLTGRRIPADVEPWVVDPIAKEQLSASLVRRIAAAGPNGVSLATLDPRERALTRQLEQLVVDSDVVRAATAVDALLEHPVIAELRAGGFAPQNPSADRDTLRRLRQRGILIERDGIWFHEATIIDAGQQAADLLSVHPTGFTVSQFCAAINASRKYGLPLLQELDSRGLTRNVKTHRVKGTRVDSVERSGSGGSS